MRDAVTALRLWPARRFALAAGVAVLAALLTGIPTDLIDTPLFGRSIDVTVWAYPVWIASSALIGLLVATAIRRPEKPAAGGGLLTLLAVGCPVCNKPVLILLGTAGALDWWEPLQPILGGIAILLLAVALVLRLRGEVSCPAPAGTPGPAA
ncbi:MAG: hypothetical protein R3C15_05485 [Thermoleophilia bacterium]